MSLWAERSHTLLTPQFRGVEVRGSLGEWKRGGRPERGEVGPGERVYPKISSVLEEGMVKEEEEEKGRRNDLHQLSGTYKPRFSTQPACF